MLYSISLLKNDLLRSILAGTVITGFIILDIIRPDIISHITIMYTNVFEVLQGENTGELSADARAVQVVRAWEFFSKHPATIFFGNNRK